MNDFYGVEPFDKALNFIKEDYERLKEENKNLRTDLEYEMTRSQALRELNPDAIDRVILDKYTATNNNFIEAIKVARYLMGTGLREAKEYVESLRNK